MKAKTKGGLPKIVRAPASVLSAPCKAVSIDGDTIKLAQRMGLVCRAARGAGLAANQIGYSQRMFVYVDGGRMITVINPEIALMSDDYATDDEGCLSIPHKFYKVARPKWVEMVYTNLAGEGCVVRGEGFLARCFMHELDHLEGKLLSDANR